MKYQQTEVSECGLICLAYAASKLGAHLDIIALRRQFPISSRGLTVKQMSEIAASLGMMARAVRCDLNELGTLKLPAILHWGMNHFVVLERVAAGRIVIHDPASGKRTLAMDDVNERFTGVALEISTSPSFQRRRDKSPLSIWSWIRASPEIYSGLCQVLVLSLMLQLYAVAAPFYMQLAIDQGAFKGNERLLLTLAFGFGLFGVFNVGADLLRNVAVQQVSAFLSWDMSIRLFRKLVRLPLPWFQRRRLADTISRMDSISPIRDLVSGAVVTTLIDGLLALTALVMMCLFAPVLATCAVVSSFLYIVARVASVPHSLRLSGEALGAQIAETAKRIETVKAIQTIKIMSAEIDQELQWGNKYSEVVRKYLARSRFQFSINAVTKLFDTITGTVIIFLGASAIIHDKITVGVLYAFMSYRSQFSNALSNVMDTTIQWRLSDIYSFRLSDIVLQPHEDRIDEYGGDPQDVRGDIDVENLGFRYSSYENWVFRGLRFTINAGEFVAIVGPSGCGKSTLLKVICGLYPATFGTIRIDGQPIISWSPKTLRSALGVVMQDDELLSGSIAENVAFFSPELDMERVWDALDAAALKGEVLAMPMKAETLVGDMGSSLSGGQKQRLLIARALYKNPRILIFDEATSHLDANNEKRINESLRALNITRVVIAHRIETIRAADKIFDVSTGRFEPPLRFAAQAAKDRTSNDADFSAAVGDAV